MNFDTWAKQFNYDFNKFGTNADSAKIAWEQCKQEVLTILQSSLMKQKELVYHDSVINILKTKI